jgi:hypothetical protein
MFGQQQELYQSQLGKLASGDPITALAEITQRNLEIWQEAQRAFMGAGQAPNSAPTDKAHEDQD